MSSFTRELNLYYGIFYPISMRADVKRALGRVYKRIDQDKYEAAGIEFFLSTNSDDDPTMEFIAIDNMTFHGLDEEYINLEPSELEKRMNKYSAAVNELIDLYDKIRVKLDDHMDIELLYMGWRVVNCTWDESTDDE